MHTLAGRSCGDCVVCAAVRVARGRLSGKFGYRDDQVGGGDFEGDSRSCMFDGCSSMQVSDTFVKLVAWYANQWPYAKRIAELLLHMQAVDHGVQNISD